MADLDSPETIRRVHDIAATLQRLPLQSEALMFRDDWVGLCSPSRLWHPLSIPSRTAVVGGRFQAAPGTRLFRWTEDTRALEAFAPQTLAADVFLLRAIAGRIEAGRLSLRELRHAIIAFSGPAQGDLSGRDQDILWRVFQVPVFEQRLGSDGAPLARECEVHDGLHVAAENAVVEVVEGELVLTSLTDTARPLLRVRTGYAASVINALCHCGRSEPRIKGLARLERRAALAYSAAV